ncbi:nicotinamide/nicotinic acid mononucleotide adenylyltransferase 3-like [Pollicipes pollicipes]|uniref:nicotinamide/nicotinic acid mononucleotide adenylyltransferase 3-like n=1 Tax=Pollicipes pollicipes TaxID=41117 RepID=UPI0018850433|nr:nicotinamide/nicotinic acid mononucleotide adenylyltransferase 3-like [Pollicipes pollicipes]
MAAPKKTILLACGSFNPPTHMHLRIFEIARDYLHRMGKHHVIAGLMSPVHDAYGKKDLAPASDRCEMVRRALQTSDWVHLSDWECGRTAWTPTRQVLQHHQELVDSMVNGNLDSAAKRQRTEELGWTRDLGTEQLHLKLLCGGDLLESFGKPGLWKEEDIEAIVGSFGLVVITREGSNPLKFIYESDVLTRLQRNIDLVTEWIANEVSSSRIRRALSRGESVKYLLPEPVIGFIQQRGLFGVTSEYAKRLSLLVQPMQLPPSFLTPSPSDVDMTYCEGAPSPRPLTAPPRRLTERDRVRIEVLLDGVVVISDRETCL